MKSAEEILKKYWIFSVDDPETQKLCIIQAMLEYADQGGQKELKEKSAKKDFKKANIKICAGCGNFAHGNPGHDITI